MTDLDTLRQALRVPPPAGPPLDVDEIITRGRRLRWRRRLAAAAGGVCVAAAVFGTMAGVGHPARTAPVPGQRPVAPSRSVHVPSPAPTSVAPTPVPAPSTTSPSPENPSPESPSPENPTPVSPRAGQPWPSPSGLPVPSATRPG
jgi:hypothetical protein